MQFSNKAQLSSYLAAGNPVKFLHFWGHTPKTDGIDKSCLSQWYPASFCLDGVTYHTAEHFMMAQKARLFTDQIRLEAILACEHPGEAKKLGRQVRNFDSVLWDQHCFAYVVQGNMGKFSQNPPLKTFLLNTKQRVLVEASPRDRIWGIGLGASHPDAGNPAAWRGQNLLGFALMAVREQLRNAA